MQLPGRESRRRHPPFTEIGPLVDALTGAVGPALDRPYTLFGHSLGALIAFELARGLRRRALPDPVELYVSACDAPQGRTRPAEPAIHTRSETALVDHLRRLGGTPEAVLTNAAAMRALLPAIRADLAMLSAYTYPPGPPLTCPIMVFGGTADRSVTAAQLAGWAEQTQGECQVRLVPDDHFFVQEPSRLLGEMLRSLPEPSRAADGARR